MAKAKVKTAEDFKKEYEEAVEKVKTGKAVTKKEINSGYIHAYIEILHPEKKKEFAKSIIVSKKRTVRVEKDGVFTKTGRKSYWNVDIDDVKSKSYIDCGKTQEELEKLYAEQQKQKKSSDTDSKATQKESFITMYEVFTTMFADELNIIEKKNAVSATSFLDDWLNAD